MRTTIIILMAILFSGCTFSIEQRLRTHPETEHKYYYCTFIWHKGDIIKSWHDPIKYMPDSIPCVRIKEAKLFDKE